MILNLKLILLVLFRLMMKAVSRGTLIKRKPSPAISILMSLDWDDAIKSLNEYRCNSYDLPSDHSLISSVARVILQKRRLLKIQEIHNILLKVSSEPSESISQVNYLRTIIKF